MTPATAVRNAVRFRATVRLAGKAATGIRVPDDVDVELAVDTEPREVAVPPDFARRRIAKFVGDLREGRG